eukprot:2428987-Prymnesium_polylepis.1
MTLERRQGAPPPRMAIVVQMGLDEHGTAWFLVHFTARRAPGPARSVCDMGAHRCARVCRDGIFELGAACGARVGA